MAAQHGYEVVLRQTMFQGHYALVGLQDLEPNPVGHMHFNFKFIAIHKFNPRTLKGGGGEGRDGMSTTLSLSLGFSYIL